MAHEYFTAFNGDGAVICQRLQLAVDQLFKFIGQRDVPELFDFDDRAATAVDGLCVAVDSYLNIGTRLWIRFRARVCGAGQNMRLLLVLHQ